MWLRGGWLEAHGQGLVDLGADFLLEFLDRGVVGHVLGPLPEVALRVHEAGYDEPAGEGTHR